MRTSPTLLPVALVLLFSGTVFGAGEAEERARKLAELRAEVEELSTQLEEERADARSRLRALRSQRADLEARISREQIRSAQAEGRVEEAKAEIAAKGTDEALVAALHEGKRALGEAVRGAIPFRTGDRLAALDEIVALVDRGELTPEQGVSRLWGAAEDELRLSTEVALHRQSISLDGVEQLVEVAHIGFTKLYFRTEEGDFGVAEQTAAGWTYRRLEDQAQRMQLDDLFGSLRKGVREGWFPLPDAPGGAS